MKKLNIAFIWHFHQPSYQKTYDSAFLLPWVRLHASKDYLDMLKRIDKFKNIKLNFNFSPILLNSLQKYVTGTMDIHLKLLIKDETRLTQADKIFILNNYFDLNYKNMVLKRSYFTELYNKRASIKELNCNMFTNQQYADIMANYTLCWMDESFKKDYPDLVELMEKEKNYTIQDRNKIYGIQLDIIRRILVEYKKYQDNGLIEVSTSPFYHPALPLLIDFKDKEIKNYENLPSDYENTRDAIEQIKLAKKKYYEIFKKEPKGMWLSEQCVCPKTAQLLAKEGFLWTILDEGILSKSTNNEFIRDFEGNLENPFNLTVNYKTDGQNPLNILFSDSFFANLINFGYGNYDSKVAANDLYEKIKTIQAKLQNSPKKNHIITIAMDGENCWETYENDGAVFLDTLYQLISEDKTLQTVTVSDYIENNHPETLENLQSGSWINRNFDLWIGEPVKNIAWLYLSEVSKDFENYKGDSLKNIRNDKDKEELDKKLKKAYREILIAQGSDWYWWYGEPNESKNDEIFDYLFRNHLINVYKILEIEVPQYLMVPLVNATAYPLRNPSGQISPSLCCDVNDFKNEWKNAGHIFVPDGPTSNVSRLIKNIHFGSDKKNLYLRFELNKNSIKMTNNVVENQIAIYIANDKNMHFSPVRFVNKNDNVYPIIKTPFSREIRFVFDNNKISRIFLNKACPWGLWSQCVAKNSKIAFKDVIELKIAFSDLEFNDKDFSFCILDATNELINEVYPQDALINLNDNH